MGRGANSKWYVLVLVSLSFFFANAERVCLPVLFEEIIKDAGTHIHTIKESSNSFGEFLFVTTSRLGAQDCIFMTFYGCGFHQYRERWLTDEWFWYQTSPYTELLRQQIPKEEAQRMIHEHNQNILPHIQPDTQTERGELFEMLADLTDEDGALAEMQGLGLL